MAVTSIATFICGLGGAECLVRRVAQDRAIYPAMLGHNLILIAVTGVVLVAAGMVILPFWLSGSPEFTNNLFGLFLLLVTNIVLVRLILLVEQIYIAHTDFVSANLSVVGFAIARTIGATIACLVFGVSTVVGWAYWQFGVHVLVAVVYALFLRRLGRPQYTIVRDELRLGGMFAAQFIFKAVRQNADLLLLATDYNAPARRRDCNRHTHITGRLYHCALSALSLRQRIRHAGFLLPHALLDHGVCCSMVDSGGSSGCSQPAQLSHGGPEHRQHSWCTASGTGHLVCANHRNFRSYLRNRNQYCVGIVGLRYLPRSPES